MSHTPTPGAAVAWLPRSYHERHAHARFPRWVVSRVAEGAVLLIPETSRGELRHSERRWVSVDQIASSGLAQ